MRQALPKIEELGGQLIAVITREYEFEFDTHFAGCPEAQAAKFIIANDYDRLQTDRYCPTKHDYPAYVIDEAGVIRGKLKGTFRDRPSTEAIIELLVNEAK